MEKIYVFGHQRPDSDSICSAIAYARFKQLTGVQEAQAFRLGNVNKETKFILDYFGVEEPEYLNEIAIYVKDLKLHKPHVISKDTPVKKVWEILKTSSSARMIPILDDFNKVEGIITLGDVAKLVLDMQNSNISLNNEILYENLINCVHGTTNKAEIPKKKVEGKMILGTNYSNEADITEQDVVVTNKTVSAENVIKNTKCQCIILTDGQTIDIETDKLIIFTKQDVYKVANNISQSVSASSIMRKDDISFIKGNQKIEEIKDLLHTSTHRNFPVIDEDDNFIGVVSRRHLIFDKRKEVILVDHNEKGQSVEGLEFARILEVIDHHRIADIETDLPLYIRSEPVGCTSTLVYKMYRENIVHIPKKMAGLMLGAILSDTLILTSPTCTSEDVNAAETLARIADVDLKEFGNAMFEASTSLEGLSPLEILDIDSKLFVIGKHEIYISQVNTLKLNSILEMADDLKEGMEKYCAMHKADVSILLVTDINLGGSEIFVAGKDAELAKKAFGIEPDKNSIFLSGVTSRKKQIVPRLGKVMQG